ncbi:MAG: UDP-N-acetylglucosamine 2-epimerase (hydrolyzing) [Lachnospiraceae bacterium]|jgi:GDP/UDP-N,N'-diacetylbacillosamine 2-epimerase (hydrolysing)|nr:UDP-N-acetylglucosamine 2-epimerase (hydrolyzing) [Lachnospiraceae bacterium]
MERLAVVTATRAEYGLLAPVILRLRNYEDKELKVELIVTGTHLSEAYGYTVTEIEEAGIRIDKKISIPDLSATECDISKNQAETLVKFTDLFVRQGYRAVLLLGDRYETLAIAIAAGNTKTPVFHMCGGDTTEGAMDEWIRHAITKISYLHFVTNMESRKRVIQLGEAPERVFNYGATGIDNSLTIADMTKEDALSSVGLGDCRYAVCTYHPVTLGDGCVEEQIRNLVMAVENYPDIQFIITKANADQGGARINALLDEAGRQARNLHVFTSLGVRRYLSLIKYAEFVLGNSSSGIIEAPAFGVPTVNIGDRQRGRLQPESIINCGESTDEICKAIHTALSVEHMALCRKVRSPYGDGHAAERIAVKIVETLREKIDQKKSFYNLDFVEG